jgi:hypothetical protein
MSLTNRASLQHDAYAISGNELSDLLAPMTKRTFMSEYWGRKPLLIKGQSDKLAKLFQGVFDRAGLYRAIQRASSDGFKGLDLQAVQCRGGYPDSKTNDLKSVIRFEQIEEMLAKRANISAENINDRRLASFAAALKAQLNHTGEIHVFATLSPGMSGFPPHIDRTDAFFMQCEGKKRYLISPMPVQQFPRGTIEFAEDGSVESYQYDVEPWEEAPSVDMTALKEVVMEPGDVLYSPAGMVHATQAVAGPTLNVNLLLYHATFLDLLSRALSEMLARDVAWRCLPPIRKPGNEPGKLPAEVKQFFGERLAELREVLNGLTPEAPELNREWHRLVAEPGEETLASMSTDSSEPSKHPIGRYDTLKLSRRAPITYAVDKDHEGNPEFYLYYGKREVVVTGAWVPFLKTMVTKKRFTAHSATTWAPEGKYPWKTVREYLELLVDRGILEREKN